MLITVECAKPLMPARVEVNRRSVGDIATVNNRSTVACHDNGLLTYLVDDSRCVNNQELLNGNNSVTVYTCMMKINYYIYSLIPRPLPCVQFYFLYFTRKVLYV